ncbi:MAG: hypothetical protein K940chlam2_01273 [Chlamydiae bacterium]|nr:hypothetical protein [Chlamydiota bacterium]
MKKRLLGHLTALALFSQPLAFAQADQPPVTADYYYDEDEEEEFFPEGCPVGAASDEGVRTARRARYRNWGLALTVLAVGVATLIIASRHKR